MGGSPYRLCVRAGAAVAAHCGPEAPLPTAVAGDEGTFVLVCRDASGSLVKGGERFAVQLLCEETGMAQHQV